MAVLASTALSDSSPRQAAHMLRVRADDTRPYVHVFHIDLMGSPGFRLAWWDARSLRNPKARYFVAQCARDRCDDHSRRFPPVASSGDTTGLDAVHVFKVHVRMLLWVLHIAG
jgi:hypothetical protein